MAHDFVQGRALVTLGEKYGFIDSQGALAVAAMYDFAKDFSDERAVVRVGQLWGVIDRDGREIVPPQYSSIRPFSDGLAVVAKPSQPNTPSQPKQPPLYGAIDVTGRVVIDFAYTYLSDFADGRASVRRDNGRLGFISTAGEIVIPETYDSARPFKDGLAVVGVRTADGFGHLLGRIDVYGHVVTPFAFGVLGDLTNGRAVAAEPPAQAQARPNAVMLAQRPFHIVDRTGARLSPDMPFDRFCLLGFGATPQFGASADPSAPVKTPDGKCMFADGEGRNRFDRNFESASPFSDGLAVVRAGAETGFGPLVRPVRAAFAGVINTRGEFALLPIFNEASLDRPGVIRVSFGDYRGNYTDRQGKPLTFTMDEMNRYIADMREALNLTGDVPGRTITAQTAAGAAYHLYLPREFCALDRTQAADARIFAEESGRLAASQEDMRKRWAANGALANAPSSPAPPLSGLFAPCEQLREFRTTGERDRLLQIGVASGVRPERQDPSANSGIVFVAGMICGAMRGIGAAGMRPETPEQRNERIAQAWAQAASGQSARLPSIDHYLLGCTSAVLSRGQEANVDAATVTDGVLPDWVIEIRTRTTLKSQSDLAEMLQRQAMLFDALTKLNLRANTRWR
jgi:hypothetical protein